ncbi:MAG: hypothetical protein FIA92_13510 [Chloroflexi bacterium]|nr:hypothetical protein [Chloroflexota bacterium]
MSDRLTERTDSCPLDGMRVRMEVCQPCRFFRGASLVSPNVTWRVLCNWPRDGSYTDPALPREPRKEGW